METLIRKLTSRKLWLAIAGIATGIAVILGADTSEIQTVAGAATSLLSAVTYIITEGKIDAARTALSGLDADTIQEAVNIITE